MGEREQKDVRIRELLEERGLDALLLRRASSFAWATCGASSYINTATEYGEGSLLYTPAGRYLLATNIEMPRLMDEEGLRDQGWEPVPHAWYETSDAVERLTGGLRLAADEPYAGAQDVTADIASLRTHLTPEEGERFRTLGRLCAEAMDAAIRQIRPGQTEHEIAALLARETAGRGVWPIVDLVATDERIHTYRHPLPTNRRLERYAMAVLCGRKAGLVCSITRLVHFGALPDELRSKQEACARVDAALLTATRPGATLGAVFGRAQTEYAASGYPDEWRLHHQGGPAGYEPRETLGLPGSPVPIAEGQAFAWNPSITGVKIEDTFLVGRERNDVLTEVEGWPTVRVEVDGQTFERPAVLEVR